MTLLHGKNYGRPTLDLNFAGNKSLIDTVTGRNLITFSRSQSGKEATYVGSDGLIKYAGADEPRFDYDPETGESLGLLVEEARTNKLINSSTFSSGYTIDADAALDLSASTAPDGTQTAALLRPTVDTTTADITRIIGAGTGDFIVSVFAKSSGKSWIAITNAQGNARVWFNLTTGQVGTVQLNFAPYFVSGSIEPFGNGWYRCSVKSTVTYNTFRVNVVDADNSTNVTVNGNDGIYIWGSQLEEGSFPTSYIPTSGSTVTRNADEASITGSNFSSWYNQSEGTSLCSYKSDSILTATNFPRIYAFNAIVGGSNTFQTVYVTAGKMNILVYADSGSLLRVDSALSGETSGITGFSYKTNESVGFINGTLSTQGRTSAPTNTDIIRLDIGGDSDFPTRILNGTISRLTYWPTRLPDLELQQLTK